MSDHYDGILDFNHAQNVSSFHDMKAAGIGAVILKAGQGLTFTDDLYRDRRNRARSVGLLVGSYWFDDSGDGGAQADKYLVEADPQPGELVCLDWETPKMSLKSAEHFVQHVHTRLGRWPVLYSGQSFLNERVPGEDSPLLKCDLWIARYSDKPPSGWWDTYSLHQFTGDGQGPEPHTAAGISGPVDRSRFSGSEAELRKWWGANG